MSTDFPPIDGKEIQVEGFRMVVHTDDDLDEIEHKFVTKLRQIFDKEFGNKIVRVSYQRGSKTFLFNAGFEEPMYNEIGDWIRELSAREAHPLSFEFRNYLSFAGPRLI